MGRPRRGRRAPRGGHARAEAAVDGGRVGGGRRGEGGGGGRGGGGLGGAGGRGAPAAGRGRPPAARGRGGGCRDARRRRSTVRWSCSDDRKHACESILNWASVPIESTLADILKFKRRDQSTSHWSTGRSRRNGCYLHRDFTVPKLRKQKNHHLIKAHTGTDGGSSVLDYVLDQDTSGRAATGLVFCHVTRSL